jgi:hypothetical protein
MRGGDRRAHGADPGGVTSGRGIVLIVAALLPFTALTLAALGEGPGAFPQAITHSWASLQIFLDLVLAVLVFCFWIHRDATLAGRNPWPWILGALAVGLLSPLLYLLTRRSPPDPSNG